MPALAAETYTAHSTAIPAVKFNKVYLTPRPAVATVSTGSASDKRCSLGVTIHMPLLPEILETRRLRLRKPKTTDASRIFATYGRDSDVAHYMVWRPHTEVEQTREFIRGCIESWKGEERLPYVIVHEGHDEPIGMLDARLHGHMVDIGYVLAKSEWGRGLMPEAIETLVSKLMSNSSVYRVQATCDVDNKASRRTLEKSGFKQEGRLERYTIHPNLSPEPRACYMYARCRGAA